MPVYRGDGARTVRVDDAAEFGGDLIEGIGAVDLLERAVGSPPQRGPQSVRVGHLVGELATLDAGVSLEQRIVEYAAYGDDTVVDDVDLHGTTGVADTTERRLGLQVSSGWGGCHTLTPPVVSVRS